MRQQLQRIYYEEFAENPECEQGRVRHARYQEIYWHLPSPALIFDVGSFELRGLNRAAVRLFGCEVNRAVGLNVQPWLPAGLAARIRDHLWAAGAADPLSGRSVRLDLPAGLRTVNITAFNLPPERDCACRQWVLLCEDPAAQDTLRELDRAELARNLHDQLGQEITVLRLALGRLQRDLAGSQLSAETWGDQVDGLARQTDTLMQSVRHIACNLRPDMLDALGLADAANRLVLDMRRQLGVRGGLEVSLDWADPDPALSLQMYRCLQELLNNMAKHSKASRFFVRMLHQEGVYWLEVIDNGVGLAASKTPDSRARLGLAGLRERAALYGGELAVQSRPQVDGCALRLSFRERRGAGGQPA